MLRLEHSYVMWPCQENFSYSFLRPEEFLLNNQLDEQFSCIFISIPYMFRSSHAPINRKIIVWMRYLIYVTVCRWPSGMQVNLHTRGSSTQSDINQISHSYNNSLDDGHMTARNRLRIEINIYEKLCVSLVIYDDYIKLHGQQNINLKSYFSYLPQL